MNVLLCIAHLFPLVEQTLDFYPVILTKNLIHGCQQFMTPSLRSPISAQVVMLAV